MIGVHTKYSRDLSLKCASTYFKALEFAPVIQILAYRLAQCHDKDFPIMATHVLPEYKYFNTHANKQ